MEKDAQAEAIRLVNTERQGNYGSPWDNMLRTALKWRGLFGVHVTPEQVALAMIELKTARAIHRPDLEDNWVDGHGYFNVYEKCVERRAQLEEHYLDYGHNDLTPQDREEIEHGLRQKGALCVAVLTPPSRVRVLGRLPEGFEPRRVSGLPDGEFEAVTPEAEAPDIPRRYPENREAEPRWGKGDLVVHVEWGTQPAPVLETRPDGPGVWQYYVDFPWASGATAGWWYREGELLNAPAQDDAKLISPAEFDEITRAACEEIAAAPEAANLEQVQQTVEQYRYKAPTTTMPPRLPVGARVRYVGQSKSLRDLEGTVEEVSDQSLYFPYYVGWENGTLSWVRYNNLEEVAVVVADPPTSPPPIYQGQGIPDPMHNTEGMLPTRKVGREELIDTPEERESRETAKRYAEAFRQNREAAKAAGHGDPLGD